MTHMPESPVIAALAKTARDGLDKADDDAARGYLHAPEIPGYTGWDTQTVVALPPAIAALILRDVAARRTLLDEALGWGHRIDGTDEWYSCSQARDGDGEFATYDDTRAGKPCDCGRDARVLAVLTALAAPYQETP